MKKNQYIVPEIMVVCISQKDGILDGTPLSASAEGQGILGRGGNTSDAGQGFEVQVKGNNYNVWEDDWSKN